MPDDVHGTGICGTDTNQSCLVSQYDPAWPGWFERLRAWLTPALHAVPHVMEHVGSTAIPGMTAKPIIDLDIVVDRLDFPRTRDALIVIGYVHQGDLGIPDREAFDLTDATLKISLPAHHLYVCMKGTPELEKHLLFRDFMRKHPDWIRRLSTHKLDLCRRHGNNRQAYIDGKSDMVQQIIELAKKEAEAGI